MMENLELLKTIVYGPNATHDDRFIWEEITPADASRQPDAIQVHLDGVEVAGDSPADAHWSDYRRYKITGCAHKYRDGGVCDTCGDDETTVKPKTKRRARRS